MDGKPIYYWTNRQDQQVPDDAGFVGIVNSTNITVRDLVLTKNSEGLLFVFTNNSNIENVRVSNNYYGIHLFGSSNNTIISNAASSNRDSSIYLEYSSNNTLINNNASNNDREGIYLGYYSNNNMLMNNIASNNDDEGIYLWGRSNNNTLQDNTVSNNDEGIYLTWDANNNTLTNNTANSNHYGIRIGSSTNNAIHHNNLLDNTLCNACDECTNQWDSGSEGNYYSDYTGTDNNTDGIGDDPHPILGGSSVDRYPLMAPYSPTSYSVGQGAPDLATKNHFIDAYNRNGGATVLGSPATEVHRAWGYLMQDFRGASGYAGGIIMYNPYNNYAYYIHGAIWERYYNLGGPRAKIDIKFELGPPTSDIKPYIHTEPAEVSSHGTQFRYQHFEGGALNHNVDAGDVFEIHGAIFAKWGELGYADDELGLVTSDEREAAQSPIGTEGRVSDFEGGHIHWHHTGGHGGTSYETHGAIDAVYCAEGGSSGDLGFPVSDEYVNPSGYPQSDFEGGYITTTDGMNYEAFEYADKTPPMLVIGTPEDGEEAETYRIKVSGVASDESGIYGVRIKVNGETAAELINSNLGTWNTNVMLSYGENEIAVTACDNYFNTETKTVTVYYQPDFTFAHVTDVHIGEDLAEPHLHNIIFELNNYYHEPKLKFALVTGDLVTWNWDWYFNGFLSSMRSLRMDKKYVPGNHDRRSEPTGVLLPQSLENYRKFFPDQTDKIVFEEGGFQFIGLDTGEDYNVSAYWGVPFDPLTLTYDHTPESRGLSQEQIEFLQQEPKNTPKIIFMHHPAIEEIGKNDVRSIESVSEDPVPSNGPGGNDGCIAFKRSEFIEYCKENNVQFVFTGHTHKDAIVSDDGTLNDRIPLSIDSYPFFIQTAAAKDGWYRIVDVKSGITLPRTSRRAESHPNWQGILACPAHLHAYDSQGRHTGLNASGGVEINIPDSFYIGRYNYSDPNETETILLYNTTEEYRFEIVANLTEEEKASPEIESFNFTVEQQTDDTRTTIAHLSVPLTENTTATLPINLTTTTYTMEIDYDGDGATDETEDPDFIVTNYAPTAAIIAPETGSIYNVSEPVEFNGTGRDPEDGILTNCSLVWYSDINGAIGAGEQFSTANLSCGAHRITLMVNDSTGLMSTQSIALTITNDWTPGDLNHDGNVTPADAAIALQIAAAGSASCDPATLAAADVSGDGCVTSLDALMILQAAAGRIEL